jgi:hypothetical protein
MNPIPRICLRQGDPRDILIHLRSFARFAIADIRTLSNGICPNYSEIRTGPQIFMHHARRDDDNVATLDRKDDPTFTPQLDVGGSLKHPQNFIRCAVIMMVAIHPIAPGTAPIVRRKQLLKNGGRVPFRQAQHPLIRQQWQRFIIRIRPIVLQNVSDDLMGGEELLEMAICDGHRPDRGQDRPPRHLAMASPMWSRGIMCVTSAP